MPILTIQWVLCVKRGEEVFRRDCRISAGSWWVMFLPICIDKVHVMVGLRTCLTVLLSHSFYGLEFLPCFCTAGDLEALLENLRDLRLSSPVAATVALFASSGQLRVFLSSSGICVLQSKTLYKVLSKTFSNAHYFFKGI